MASDAPRPIDTKQPTMPVGGPQVQSIDLRGTVPGAGVGSTGISDAIANRRPDQVLAGQRPSPGNVFGEVIEAHAAGGQAGIQAVQQLVDDGLKSTADSTGNTPRATGASAGT